MVQWLEQGDRDRKKIGKIVLVCKDVFDWEVNK